MRYALANDIGPRRANKPAWRAQEAFWPVPTEGWDTETPVAQLPLTRARVLDNCVSAGVELKIRKGYAPHCTGLGGPVESLMPYNAGGSSVLFAAAVASIFNVTTAGAVGAAVVGSLTSARFSHTNMTTSGGSFLWICNGADDPRHWNGSAWAVPSLTMPGAFTDNEISYVLAFKERLFFILKNTLVMGYLPVQSVAGTVAQFPLGAVYNQGGRLIALGSLSRDGGDGIDDYLVILTSEGEIAVYAGTNPADATVWALVGVYYVGEPIGDRPLVDVGDDLAIITAAGLVSVKRVMAATEDGLPKPLSDRITTPWANATRTGQGFTGWEGLVVPGQALLLVNAPSSAEVAVQFVRHTASKAGWRRFTGWNFETFEVFGGDCYAGGSDGDVHLCFTGHDDDGSDITAVLHTAWNTLGSAQVKTLLEVRPIVTTTTRAVLRLISRTDFRDAPVLPAWPMSTITNALVWGEGDWGEKLWGGEDATTRQWRAISGDGHNVSLAIEARANQSDFGLNGMNIRYSIGGQV